MRLRHITTMITVSCISLTGVGSVCAGATTRRPAPPGPARVVAPLRMLKTPAQRAAFHRWMLHLAIERWIAALPPASTSWGAPSPVSSLRCPDGYIKATIVSTFGVAAPWAESVAMRESHCTAGAYNPSGASGVLQLLGHQSIVQRVCPSAPNVFDARCNVLAGFELFKAAGTSPWRL